MSELYEMKPRSGIEGWLDSERRWKQRQVDIALAMLRDNTSLSTSDIDAIESAIESGNPLYCIANKEVAKILTVLAAGAPYKQATGEDDGDAEC